MSINDISALNNMQLMQLINYHQQAGNLQPGTNILWGGGYKAATDGSYLSQPGIPVPSNPQADQANAALHANPQGYQQAAQSSLSANPIGQGWTGQVDKQNQQSATGGQPPLLANGLTATSDPTGTGRANGNPLGQLGANGGTFTPQMDQNGNSSSGSFTSDTNTPSTPTNGISSSATRVAPPANSSQASTQAFIQQLTNKGSNPESPSGANAPTGPKGVPGGPNGFKGHPLANSQGQLPGSYQDGSFYPMMSVPGNQLSADSLVNLNRDGTPNWNQTWVNTANGPMFKSDIQNMMDQNYWANATSQNGNGMWGGAVDHYNNMLSTLGIPGTYASYGSQSSSPQKGSPLDDPYGGSDGGDGSGD